MNARAAVVSVLLISSIEAARAQGSLPRSMPAQAPFVTALPWILPDGAIEASFFGSWSANEPLPFSEGTAPRPDLSRLGLLGEVARGLGGRVEASARLGAQSVSGDAGDESLVATDLWLGFGYSFTGGHDADGVLSARFSAKVPTAPDDGGAGTDEADLALDLSAGILRGRLGLFGSAGIALLGNPLRNGSQDDVADYGAGIWIHADGGWDLTGEIEGRAFSRFGNSAASVHVGFRTAPGPRPGGAASASWFVSFARGLNEDAPLWGATLGLTLQFL